MLKKITTLLAVLAFASSASVALACNSGGGCSSKKDDNGGTEFSSIELFDVAGSGCDRGCGSKKDGE